MTSILTPQRIAVIGASATRDEATGNHVIRNLLAMGFEGTLVAVSVGADTISGAPTVPAIADLPPVDTAVVTVAGDRVLGVVTELHETGVPSAVVLTSGMSPEQLEALADYCRRTGMLVHGPNCMGSISPATPVAIWADEGNLVDVAPGAVGLISQSGSAAIFVARALSGGGLSHVVSTGNEISLTTADFISALVGFGTSRVIGTVIESLPDRDGFLLSVAEAHAAQVPVVALKVGRSRAGAAATIAHTGALVSDAATQNAFFTAAGVPLVDDYDELASALDLLSRVPAASLGAGRLGVVTISGGQSALASDLAEQRGVVLADLTEATRARLAEVLPGAIVGNPVDVGASNAAGDDAYEEVLRIVAADAGVDVVVAIVDSQSTLNDTEIAYEDDMMEAVNAVARATSDAAFVVASSSSMTLHPSRIPTEDRPVPVLRGIGNAFTAIRAGVESARGPRDTAPRPDDLLPSAAAAVLRERVAASGGEVSGELARELLSAYGIPFVGSLLTADVDEAVAWSAEKGYPVVVKIDSPDIGHRSDVGGVVVGVQDEAALRKAWDGIRESVRAHRPDARIVGLEVQRQISDSVEVFVGALGDLHLGATIGVGMGGVLVEVLDDTQHALAPIDATTAGQVLGRTRVSKLLAGYRGLRPPIDTSQLIETVSRISWLAADLGDALEALDINPILVEPDGRATVIDALMVARPVGVEGTRS